MLASSMSAFAPAVRGRFISVPRRSSSRKGGFAVRATQETQEKVEEQTTTLPATYFYGGRAYSEQEWRQAKADGSLYQPAPPETYYSSRTVADDEAMGLGELMAFAGPAPELINGRLAMLAFVSALAAELASGESVLKQWADEPTGVLLGASVLAIGSLFPLIESRRKEAFGIFTPDAEMLNGRAAMIGFAALLVIEGIKGSALF